MNFIQRWLKNFFGFSRSQVNGFMILLPLMAIFIFSEPVYRWWISQRVEDHSEDQKKLDSLISYWELHPRDSSTKSHPHPVKEQRLFSFDPNNASVDELQELGFPKYLSFRIVRFREKGGGFKVKKDLLKIYGMDSTLYHRVVAFIQLPDEIIKKEGLPYAIKIDQSYTKKAPLQFDINQADTATFKKIYGIGEKLALRIVTYREKLGGFIIVNQVAEIKGLDSAVVDKLVKASFVAEGFVVKAIILNTANEQELSAHPYLSKSAAKAIVSYRFQHGDIASIEDLQKIQALDPKTIEKITPYLEFK